MTTLPIIRHQVRTKWIIEIKNHSLRNNFNILYDRPLNFVIILLDDRFCQYNIKEVLYDVRSQYQHIIICDTIDSGRLLVLDGLANLAEKDTIPYTHALLDMTKVLQI